MALDDLIPHKDRNAEDQDLCVTCGKDVGARAGPSVDKLPGSSVVRELDNYGLFFTPAGTDTDGIYILAWCSRECIFEWARQLLEKFVGVKRADLLNLTSSATCAHGNAITLAPADGAYCPCCQVRASDDQNPVECALCVSMEAGEVAP